MEDYYSWVVAFHVMSFISWMAFLLYMPRLFIYHREKANIRAFTDVVKVQESKLHRIIGVPAMWATVITGGVMMYLNPAIFDSGIWMIAKLIALSFLLVYHISLGKIRVIMLKDPHYKNSKWFRIYNEVPTLLMIFIVIMVIVKPF
jgi:putative membrane protein